jgi:acetolactate synthase-1/2/3 large subunit
VFANRKYEILKGELAGVAPDASAHVRALLDIGTPDLDFVALARGMGVPACRVATLESFASALTAGYASASTSLIEVPL